MNKVDAVKGKDAYRDWFRQPDRREGWFPFNRTVTLTGNLFFNSGTLSALDLSANNVRFSIRNDDAITVSLEET